MQPGNGLVCHKNYKLSLDRVLDRKHFYCEILRTWYIVLWVGSVSVAIVRCNHQSDVVDCGAASA
jgi:hypothetical protein